jgi:hypothetical protein
MLFNMMNIYLIAKEINFESYVFVCGGVGKAVPVLN